MASKNVYNDSTILFIVVTKDMKYLETKWEKYKWDLPTEDCISGVEYLNTEKLCSCSKNT